MKTLILLGIVVAGLVVSGAIQINQSGNSLQVTIDEKKLEATAAEAMKDGQAMLHRSHAPAR
ncbi:MAG: hypothetical protein WCQ91_07815 [Planctomycetota bacterium]